MKTVYMWENIHKVEGRKNTKLNGHNGVNYIKTRNCVKIERDCRGM